MNAISNNSKPIEPKGMGKRERERREKELLLGYHMQLRLIMRVMGCYRAVAAISHYYTV